VPNPTPQQIGNEIFGPGRVEPGFNDVFLLSNSSSSSYNGLTSSLNLRMTKGVELIGSYTFSKTIDDASDFDEQPQNPYNLGAERALSSQNQQQWFTFNSLWNLPIPGEIELVPIITVGTGRPVNPLVGLNSNRNDAFPLSARPQGVGRNALQTPGLANVDFGVVKTVKFGEYRHLDLIVQFFNLMNHVSTTAINPFFGTGIVALPSFGQPIQGLTPRQIQFGANFEY
jgi:hypothetical protein